MEQFLAKDGASPATETSLSQMQMSRPVDLVHLSRYTLGNRDIEREVLELFRTQSSLYLRKLKDAMSNRAWREAAHTIKGSARGIGAWHVATAAAAAEALENAAENVGREETLDELAVQIDEANGFIAAVLSDI